MVGAGIFDAEFTRHSETSVMPRGVDWIKKSASGFAPEDNQVLLDDGSSASYRVLVACPGIKLDWDAIPGLSETLGKNGVTRSEEHTSELQSLMRISYAVFCLKKNTAY